MPNLTKYVILLCAFLSLINLSMSVLYIGNNCVNLFCFKSCTCFFFGCLVQIISILAWVNLHLQTQHVVFCLYSFLKSILSFCLFNMVCSNFICMFWYLQRCLWSRQSGWTLQRKLIWHWHWKLRTVLSFCLLNLARYCFAWQVCWMHFYRLSPFTFQNKFIHNILMHEGRIVSCTLLSLNFPSVCSSS